MKETEIQRLVGKNLSHGVGSGWYDGAALHDVSEDEERQMREAHEIVRLRNNRPHLHPIDPDTGHPYCAEVYTDRKRLNWQSVNLDAVPVGYYPVCTVCGHFWREDDGRQ